MLASKNNASYINFHFPLQSHRVTSSIHVSCKHSKLLLWYKIFSLCLEALHFPKPFQGRTVMRCQRHNTETKQPATYIIQNTISFTTNRVISNTAHNTCAIRTNTILRLNICNRSNSFRVNNSTWNASENMFGQYYIMRSRVKRKNMHNTNYVIARLSQSFPLVCDCTLE